MEQQPQFFIYKNRNKTLVKIFMNNLDWEANNSSQDLANQDKLSMEQLRAMQLVAKMKEAADRCGAGFVGGFISPTGQRFMMSNVDSDDVQTQAINAQLDAMQDQRLFELMQDSDGEELIGLGSRIILVTSSKLWTTTLRSAQSSSASIS